MIICITSGGGYLQTKEERIRAVEELKPEPASFDVGTMNYGVFPMVEKAARLIREVGFEVASPDETRSIVRTKGRDRVTF